MFNRVNDTNTRKFFKLSPVDGEATASATVETVAPKYKTKNIDLILYGMFIDVVVVVV